MSKFKITYQGVPQKARGCDPMGCGHFGASRGNRKHKGFDIRLEPGQGISAPFDCVVTKNNGQVYSSTDEFRYVEILGKGFYSPFRMRFFYVTQEGSANDLTLGQNVEKGGNLGLVQDIAGHHGGGMKNHVHVELKVAGVQVDPEPFFNLD